MGGKDKISEYFRAVALCFSPYKRTRQAPFHKERDLLRVNRERAYISRGGGLFRGFFQP